MNLDEARRLAEEALRDVPAQVPLTLLDDVDVEDRGWCYLFHFQSTHYLETRDPADALPPGFGPIVVNKDGSDVWHMGSTSFEWQLDRYAEEHGIK